MGCNSDECTFPKRDEFDGYVYYVLDGRDLNYISRLKNRLGQMQRMTSDEMRDAMNKLVLILDRVIKMD
jgi:hypothetical protein